MTKQDALKFRYRLGDLEARMTGKNLAHLADLEDYTIEIVKHQPDDTVYVVAYFKGNSSKDEWTFCYVGNRPMSEDQDIMRKMFEVSYDLLNSMYSLPDESEEIFYREIP